MDDIKESTPPVRCYSYIRFSSKEQRKGDSLRRQTAYAAEYAKNNGLMLDDSLKITDFGFSAFHGDHISKGALGVFLEQVKAGKIPIGSHLVIEALDRLSRENLLQSYDLFMNLIRAGIVICTAADSMVYGEGAFESIHVMLSAFKLAQGHEESLKKQQRLLKVWETKRGNISKKKLTAMAPEWLTLSKDKSVFKIIPERAEAVKRIFELKLNGCGAMRSTRILNNSEGWKPQSNRGNKLIGWQHSYIERILRSKAVIGEFQPHVRIDGKRQPIGDPIPNYYPRIIDDETFFAVQDQFVRNTRKGGRNGKFNNLFSTLIKCGYCGAPMHYVNKGETIRGGQYLVCDNARRALGCFYHGVRYPTFEKLMLKYCKGLDPTGILPDSSVTQSKLIGLQSSLASKRGKLVDLDKKIDNLTDALIDCPDKKLRDKLKDRLSVLIKQNEQCKEVEKKILNLISQLTSSYADTQIQLDNVKELIDKLPEAPPEIRELLRNRLRSLIDKIVVYPVGNPRLTPEYIESYLFEYKSMVSDATDEEIQQYRLRLTSMIGNMELGFCNVSFQCGSFRTLNLARLPEMPLEFDKEKNRLINRFINRDRVEDKDVY